MTVFTAKKLARMIFFVYFTDNNEFINSLWYPPSQKARAGSSSYGSAQVLQVLLGEVAGPRYLDLPHVLELELLAL